MSKNFGKKITFNSKNEKSYKKVVILEKCEKFAVICFFLGKKIVCCLIN